jgi:hypothetical protein
MAVEAPFFRVVNHVELGPMFILIVSIKRTVSGLFMGRGRSCGNLGPSCTFTASLDSGIPVHPISTAPVLCQPAAGLAAASLSASLNTSPPTADLVYTTLPAGHSFVSCRTAWNPPFGQAFHGQKEGQASIEQHDLAVHTACPIHAWRPG